MIYVLIYLYVAGFIFSVFSAFYIISNALSKVEIEGSIGMIILLLGFVGILNPIVIPIILAWFVMSVIFFVSSPKR